MTPPVRAAARRLVTERLDLRSLDARALDALSAGDRMELEALTGARFPSPLEPPPLVEDHLDFFRDRLRRPSEPGSWWFWLMVTRDAGDAVGMVGLPGEPDEHGRAPIGYSVYPSWEGRGYATEAVGAVLDWVLGQSGIAAVRATIAPDNAGSLRVATKVGMRAVAIGRVMDVGEVVVFERRAGGSGDEAAARR